MHAVCKQRRQATRDLSPSVRLDSGQRLRSPGPWGELMQRRQTPGASAARTACGWKRSGFTFGFCTRKSLPKPSFETQAHKDYKVIKWMVATRKMLLVKSIFTQSEAGETVKILERGGLFTLTGVKLEQFSSRTVKLLKIINTFFLSNELTIRANRIERVN